MKIWAISDLHLPGIREKKMDIFGERWNNHVSKIESAWRDLVSEDDIVLLPGDLSWAMRLKEVEHEFRFLEKLPGSFKILIRGNHDYWWVSKRKLNSVTAPETKFLYNTAVRVSPFVFAGARGWDIPSSDCEEEVNVERERLCRREVGRLLNSIECAQSFSERRLIVIMHFPPVYKDGKSTVFTDVLDEVKPEVVVYGHLHGEGIESAFEGIRGGTRYVLSSADAIDFKPILIAEC